MLSKFLQHTINYNIILVIKLDNITTPIPPNNLVIILKILLFSITLFFKLPPPNQLITKMIKQPPNRFQHILNKLGNNDR